MNINPSTRTKSIALTPRTIPKVAKRIAVCALVMSASLGLVGAQPASASPNEWAITHAEKIDCIKNFGLWDCNQASHAANWAKDVTNWKFPNVKEHHNNAADAFRHCAWMGALATRVGARDAYAIGHLHERHAPNPSSEFYMDIQNNWRGAQYGQAAKNARLSDTWGYVLRVCESGAKNKRLFGLWGARGNY